MCFLTSAIGLHKWANWALMLHALILLSALLMSCRDLFYHHFTSLLQSQSLSSYCKYVSYTLLYGTLLPTGHWSVRHSQMRIEGIISRIFISYTQIFIFLKSHHFINCVHLIFLYIIRHNNISWRPPQSPSQNLGVTTPNFPLS